MCSAPSLTEIPLFCKTSHFNEFSAEPSKWSYRRYAPSPSLVVVAAALPYHTVTSPAVSAPSSRTANRALSLE
ncbi:MAG: hypothetical protein PHD55_05495 [Methanoregula sp.]|nr:hypothetical protein [Methanoregula sp.]